MKNLCSLILVLILSLGICNAQNTITKIRDQYKLCKQQIEDCSKGKEKCALYVNSLIINKEEQPWRGSGTYNKAVQFWYDDTPLHCDECGKNGVATLKFISSNTISGLANTYEEWLFKKGTLTFYYQKKTGEYPSELRYYYLDGTLIRFTSDGEQFDGERALTKDHPNILNRASVLQQTFLLGFN